MKMITAQQVRSYLYPRKRNTHKGDYGHLLAIGGSAAKPGAILMTGKAALRSGSGLVTVALPGQAFKKLSKNFLELMYAPLASDAKGEFSGNAGKSIKTLLSGKSAVVVGPGMGMGRGAKTLLAYSAHCFGCRCLEYHCK